MDFSKSTMIVVAGGVIVGVLAGFTIWGTNKPKKMEIREILRMATQEIEKIDNENRKLNKIVKKFGGDEKIDNMLKNNKDLKAQLMQARQSKADLEGMLTALKTEKSESEKQIVEQEKTLSEGYAGKFAELEQKNKALKEELQFVHKSREEMQGVSAQMKQGLSEESAGMQATEEVKTINEDLKKRVALLEEENRKLTMQFRKSHADGVRNENLLAQLKKDLSAAREKAQKVEEFSLVGSNLKNEITRLEKENKDLRGVIEKISGMVTE